MITGGAGIIGKEFVRAVVEQEGIAVIADIDDKRGEKVKYSISKELNSTNIEFFEFDITSKSSIQRCIKYLDKKYQRIDALVNNAYPKNKSFGKHFMDIDYSDFTENVGLHLGGYVTTSQYFADYFRKQGYGNIVNISSIYGAITPKFEIYSETNMTVPIEYAAAKSGLNNLTRYMAKFFKGDNIRINTISPGGILNDQPKEFLEQYNMRCSTKGMLDAADLKGTLVFYIMI